MDKLKVPNWDQERTQDKFLLGKMKTKRYEKYGPTTLRLKKSDEIAAKFVQVILKNKMISNFAAQQDNFDDPVKLSR